MQLKTDAFSCPLLVVRLPEMMLSGDEIPEQLLGVIEKGIFYSARRKSCQLPTRAAAAATASPALDAPLEPSTGRHTAIGIVYNPSQCDRTTLVTSIS